MASVQIKKTYAEKSDAAVFDAAKKAITNAGFKVWKTRDLAKLVLGTGEADGSELRLNVMVSMLDASVTISVESDTPDETVLAGAVEKIHQEMQKLLG